MNIHFSCCCLNSRKWNAALCKSGHRKERREVCVVAQHFIFLLHWSGFQNRKRNPCAAVCVRVCIYTIPILFYLQWRIGEKYFCLMHFLYNRILSILSMFCFCFLIQRADSALLHVHFQGVRNSFAAGRGGQDHWSGLLCSSNLQKSFRPCP